MSADPWDSPADAAAKPPAFAIETHSTANMGDHAERLTRSFPVVPGETVEHLVARLFPRLGMRWGAHDYTDEIVIRVMAQDDVDLPDPTT